MRSLSRRFNVRTIHSTRHLGEGPGRALAGRYLQVGLVGLYNRPAFDDLVVLLLCRPTAIRAEVAVILQNILTKISTTPPTRLFLLGLPPHLISHILTYLDASGLRGVYATCRAFRRARDDTRTLSTTVLHSSVMESMLFAHAADGFSRLEHLLLDEPYQPNFYGGRHWSCYAASFLLRPMPALRSLSLTTRPTILCFLDESLPPMYDFSFETPGFGGFLDVTAVHKSIAKPMPNLQSLTIDCSDRPYQEDTVPLRETEDSRNYHVPLGIFAHDTASLRRCFIRGIAWPNDQLVGAFRSLKSFAYAGCEELDSERLERFIEAIPTLQSLRLHISGFSDSTEDMGGSSTATGIGSGIQEIPELMPQSEKYSTRFARLRHVLVGLNGRRRPNNEVERSLIKFFVRNGAPDIALILASEDEHDFRAWGAQHPEGLLRVSELACGTGNVSIRFVPDIAKESNGAQAPYHRTRVLGAGTADGAYMARSALYGISLAHLTTLSISERFTRGILENTVDQWTPVHFYLDPTPVSDRAPQLMTFPALERLTVWLLSCSEFGRYIFDYSSGPANSRLLEDRISSTVSATIPSRFPSLNTFELSAGTRPNSTRGVDNVHIFANCCRMEQYFSSAPSFQSNTGDCICHRPGGGYVTSLYDLTEFLVDCAFPKLARVHVYAIELVDYDLASTFLATQHALPSVEWKFDVYRASCDVESVDRSTPYGADEIFEHLEGRW